MKKVLVIFGGCSTEYEVSLTSAAAVANAIDRSYYDVLYLGISRQGKAYFFEGNTEAIAADTWQEKALPATISMSRGTPALWVCEMEQIKTVTFDIAFPIMHGKNGEDGTLQGLCEMAGIPIAGCGMESSAIGMDKNLAHILAREAGVKVPECVVLKKTEDTSKQEKKIDALGLPVFVKPVRAGSSFGITCVTKRDEMVPAIQNAFLHDTEVIVEEAVKGFEVGCAIMGNDSLVVGRVDEIELAGESEDGFFDYEEKYTLKTSKIHMPARLDSGEEERIRAEAVKIYRALGCRGFARVDLFYTPEKEIVFNEVNTIPGFTAHSRFPGMMNGIGYDFADTVNTILRLSEEAS